MQNFESMHTFSNIIFAKVIKEKLDYVDAIVSYCEEIEVEIDSIIALISPALKSKLEEEVISARLIKSSTVRLTF